MENSTKPWIIVDIDGVIANNSHRLYFLSKSNHPEGTDWDNYHIAGAYDPPIKDIVLLINFLAKLVNVCYITGRTEVAAQITQNWLEKYISHRFGMTLITRAENDHESGAEYKRRVYSEYFIRGERRVWLVFEDGMQSVRMWRDLGLTCLQPMEEFQPVPGGGVGILSQAETDALIQGINSHNLEMEND